MTYAMTLRIPDDLHERLRKEAFDKRVSINTLVVQAIEKAAPGSSTGCDTCGAPYVQVTTPGGFRFCEKHAVKVPRFEQERTDAGSDHA